MTNEQTRADFEADRLAQGWQLSSAKRENGHYVQPRWQAAWKTWQAAILKANQRQWVGLTDAEATALWEAVHNDDSWELIKRVEAKLKEKNT